MRQLRNIPIWTATSLVFRPLLEATKMGIDCPRSDNPGAVCLDQGFVSKAARSTFWSNSTSLSDSAGVRVSVMTRRMTPSR